MRTVSLRTLALLALLVPGRLVAQENPDQTAVQRVIATFADNVHTGNLAANDALFMARGVHILTGNAALHNWAAFRDDHLMAEIARYQGARYAHTGVESTIRGNIAWAAFRWQVSGSGETPAPVLGRGTAVLEKVGDRWLIAHLHFSR
jgi:ketosteroid isomerase-like protein